MFNSNSKNNTRPGLTTSGGPINSSSTFPTSSASSTRSIKRQMSAASHATLTIGSSRISSGTQSNFMNRKVGSTITVGRRNNHDLDSLHKESQLRVGTTPAHPGIISKSSSTNAIPLDKDENKYPIQLTVWFHELRASPEDIIIDSSAFPGGVQIGQVFELQALEGSAKRKKKLIFIVNEHNLREHLEETRVTIPTKSKFQISLLSNPLQNLLDLPARSQVQIKKVPKLEDVTVELVEIFIKDVNLTRDSMWNFSSQLVGTCGYVDQRLTYLSNRTGIIKYMYKNGKEVFSGYISQDTKIIFRSESAKLTVLIQLSSEMWHFEENGEIMFHKLVNNLFPRIFRRWRDKNTHHSITIVLFASVDLTDIPWTVLSEGERPPNRRDYYRVVVDQVNILYWDRIMANLRLEFANFKRDIMLNRQENFSYKIEGDSLPSVKGNFLEAVNVGLTLLIDRFRNTDLKHSLSHFIMITAGTGLFDVDYDLLLETSKKITGIDTSLDIICLSQPPLHVTPLFRYLKEGKVCYCVPNWCDISFYRDKSAANGQWIPRCKIYELQMMGVMENEVNDARIPRFHANNNDRSILDVMNDYDEAIFKPINHVAPSSPISFKTQEPKFEPPPVKDSQATLSLIFNPRPALMPSDSTTSTSAAVGTVARPNTDVSALSTLYTLNKNTEGKPPSPGAPSIKSLTPVSTLRIIHSHRKESDAGPRIIKSDKFLKQASEDTLVRKPPQVISTSGAATINTIEEKKLLRNRKKSSILVEPELTKSTDLFWWEISNPSQELNNNVLLRSQVSRWSNVFPSKAKRKMIKWRSFQAPAALPISTEVFPSPRQLESDYTFQIYTVFLNYENYLELSTTSQLMKEMIQLRLLLGFQICYGERVKRAEMERKPAGSPESVIKYFPESSCLGSRIYMMLDDEIHRIFCDYSGNLNVQLYRRTDKDNIPHKITLGQSKIKPYFPLIRTRYADDYTPTMVDSISVQPQKYNWNQFDQLIAGFDDAMPESKKEFHKMKFVVLPTDIPKNAYFISNENLSPEEIRVEGLRKLIAVIERGTYKKNNTSVKSKKEERFSDMIFYTGNLYDFLKEEADNYDMTGAQPTLMLPENVRFDKSIKLADLAKEMQGPSGLKLVDRTWHFKRHLDCFVGSELVTWLLECFEDIDSREEATSYGQSLMTRGLFKHVESRHGLLDGYYFYRFADEYFEKTARTWFGTKRDGQLTPKKSDNDLPKLPGVDDLQKLTKISSRNVESESSSMTDSGSRRRRKFILSKSIKFDVDPLKKSYRPELVTVHYDRVHNPEHCYHIRLQWLNTTTKFIEDTITAWSRLCERHGLKLIETPWKELCAVPTISPFHSFVEMILSLDPWLDPEFVDDTILSSNRYYFHLYFLKKLEFLLDNRSTSFFSNENVDITYSWGKPTFKYAQFIHKTGAYIIELRSSGGFFLAPNNIHLTRINSSMPSKGDYDNANPSKINTLDSQKVMLKFRAACQNKEFLREIFREAKETWKEQYLSPIS
ncbi:vacuolar membrane-associated protein IML1, partial [Spathaspora passalidarum NRRL Y-27907]